MKSIQILCLCLLLPACIYAQWDVGIGGAFESPFLISKDAGGYNHYTGVPAGRLTVNYLPPDATFIPSLSFAVAPYILPVTKIGFTDRALLMHFTTYNAMLHCRIVKQLNNGKELYYGIGIGATYMQGHSVSLSGDQASYITVIEDSADYIKTVKPQVSLSAEYRMPVNATSPFSLGIGVNVLYSYYFEQQTTWKIDIIDDRYNLYRLNPRLSGHLINPAVYFILYYRFGKNRG